MTTAANPNTATVAAVYEAFGRGDVPCILDQLANDVLFDADWTDNHGQRAGVAHLMPRRGPAQVAEFFALIASWQVEQFQVLDLIGSGDQVVAEIRAGFQLPNGGQLIDEELHLWTFNALGKVVRFRHYVDTAKHLAVAAGPHSTTD
jgi:ketosteroid isomerase-like protein